MRGRLWAITILIVVAAACEAFGGGDSDSVTPPAEPDSGSTPPPPPSIEASIPDAAADAPTSDALANGDFESTGAGCGPDWDAAVGTAQSTPYHRSGALGCSLCNADAGPYGAIYHVPRVRVPEAGTFRLRAYAAHDPDGGVDGSAAGIFITAFSDQGAPIQTFTGEGAAGATFQPIEVTVPIGSTMYEIEAWLESQSPADRACVVFDDVTLIYEP